MNTPAKMLSLAWSVALLFSSAAFADEARKPAAKELPAPKAEIPLYSGIAPGSENWKWEERSKQRADGGVMVQNVVRPVLLFYPAGKMNAVGTTMIVAPGGGFRNLMMDYEGVDIARRLNDMGIDAFVLKYRLGYTDDSGKPVGEAKIRGPFTEGPQKGQDIREISSNDGKQAVRLLRQHGKEYGVRPERLGMIGFSAGGYVTIETAMGPAETRPDFAAPLYCNRGMTFEKSTTPPAGAPPLFLAVSADDQAVGYEPSIDLFTAWQKAKLPAELHVFQMGGHAFRKTGGGGDHFMDRFEEWLRVNGWLNKAGS